MILVADSGSTKTEWITDCGHDFQTQGINPVRDTLEQIQQVISTELMPRFVDVEKPIHIFFYGAGCIPPFQNSVVEALHEAMPDTEIFIGSDLLGAARALCGKDMGIACILGTGSNSCLCANGEIVQNTHPLGYILGDEGSGAVLGRTLVGEMLKGSLKHLWPQFQKETNLTESDLISHVYRQPLPNRFLAGLVPFIAGHSDDDAIKEMLESAFTAFLQRNVIPYGHPQLPINMVGGIASQFEKEISESILKLGLKPGKVLKRPAPAMLEYHISNV